MELVHVRLTMADLVSPGRVVLPHTRTGLSQPLDVGDELVVTDQDGEFHGATVIAVGGDGADPQYHLKIGSRLPLDLAAQRMTDVDLEPENAGLHEVVDLLGELRGMLRHIDRT
ncbi:hypothetical protein P5P86_18745 [Nocardioides sp. BP30]|uniref:hypothetical protein n=1 Tax=Nocardioides sp. BP30 TaxID=3036374 RepID=UPI002468E0B8|nr:hypothetical protein [Nocardioides sp. BP30]WGL51978.1 hypothetical protein P5P86_18745 [Nocardioides sp. BP30]